jgi:hypothetical protein
MTELERLVGAVLSQWRADGGGDHDPIAVSALLDRVLPYRVARRMLGIDSSEDYEALVLRLLSEEESLVHVSPDDAAELARATANSRLPDLDVLQLLRPASFTVADRILGESTAAPDVPQLQETSTWAAADVAAPEPEPEPEPEPVPEPGPAPAITHAEPSSRATEAQRAAGVDGCWNCTEPLPVGRHAKFCPFCGADQRQPMCAACGALAERGWKHCAECGAKL